MSGSGPEPPLPKSIQPFPHLLYNLKKRSGAGMALDSHSDSSHVQFLLNGRAVRAEGFAPQTTLLDFLRSQDLTGAKEGCAEGECGACTVVMVGRTGALCGPSAQAATAPPSATAYIPVNSCLLFLPMLAGQEIYTVEALANHGPLTEVQQALVDFGGSQCGYCTPGFVMSLFAEQYRPGREGPCDPHAMGGNLCRCTGYRPIRDAALSLGPTPPRRISRPSGRTRASPRAGGIPRILAPCDARRMRPRVNTVHLTFVAQAVEPAEPRFISAFIAALDQR